MNDTFPEPDPLADHVDRVCDRFEQAWQDGLQPRIEEYLADATEPLRSRLWTELLLSELECRRRRGDVPTLDEYRSRFPDRYADIERLLAGGATLPAVGVERWPSAALPGPGRQVGGYEVLAEIARGGMGVVYKARQAGLNRIVALKMILTGAHAGAEERARFRREAEAVARLRHPHIVQIHEIGEEGDLPFLSMEYVDGPSLDRLLVRRHARGSVGLTPHEAARLVETLARTIHHAHQCGVVHRDLKPANVLLAACGLAPPAKPQAAEWVPKITDFGLAKFLDEAGGRTRTGAILGTPSYAAPEQLGARGSEVGPTADIYALGVILFELLTGRVPFQGATLAETLELVRKAEPPPPAQLQPRLPRDLQTICLKCLRKEPARRYASALALAEDLRRFLAGEPIHARPVSTAERAVKWVRRQPAVAALLAAVVLTAVVAFGVVAWQWRVADQARIEAEAVGAERLIALAQSHWLLDDLPAARRFLADCPPKYRTPDWHHLRWLCHAEIASQHDPDVRGEVVFAPDGTGLLWNSKRSVKFWSGSGDPVTVCEAPGDLLGPPAVNDEGDRVTFVSAGKPVLLGAFGEPDEPLFQRVVSVCDRKSGRCLTQWTCEASQDHALLQPLSPDGRLVFVPRKESWTIRDAGSGKVLRAFPAPLPTALAFGRRSQLLAYSSEKVPGITVWDDLAADRAAHHVSHPESVGRIAFSPDGRRLAYLAARREASGAARWIHVWDLARRQEITAWSVPHAYAMAFSPNGRFLAYADQDKVIRIRNLDADRDAAALRGHTNSFIRLSCSPDGTRLVSVAPGGSIKVWDLQPLAEPDARP